MVNVWCNLCRVINQMVIIVDVKTPGQKLSQWLRCRVTIWAFCEGRMEILLNFVLSQEVAVGIFDTSCWVFQISGARIVSRFYYLVSQSFLKWKFNFLEQNKMFMLFIINCFLPL